MNKIAFVEDQLYLDDVASVEFGKDIEAILIGMQAPVHDAPKSF